MMRDSQHDGRADRESDRLALLARAVVARIAAREAPREPDPSLVEAAARAIAAPEPAAFQMLRADLRRARVSDTDLVDTYFPAVARYLGCAWAEDRMPFTDVSIGTARMQAMLRQLGRDGADSPAAGSDGATVLMVLPEGEQHSLGAMILSGQLRRQGVSVQVLIGADPLKLRAVTAAGDFDCAMISVACEERLALCCKLVKSLKDGSGGRLRVALGGAVLDRRTDILGLTGADIVTNDPRLALDGVRARALSLLAVE